MGICWLGQKVKITPWSGCWDLPNSGHTSTVFTVSQFTVSDTVCWSSKSDPLLQHQHGEFLYTASVSLSKPTHKRHRSSHFSKVSKPLFPKPIPSVLHCVQGTWTEGSLLLHDVWCDAAWRGWLDVADELDQQRLLNQKLQEDMDQCIGELQNL